MLDKLISILSHPLKNFCLPEKIKLLNLDQLDNETMTKLLDVYMDDFISLAQAPTHAELLHFT